VMVMSCARKEEDVANRSVARGDGKRRRLGEVEMRKVLSQKGVRRHLKSADGGE
jgi:hypothetical protein